MDIARKLLTLGTYLQVVSSQSEGDYRDVVTRVFGTVGRLVTHNDELPGSVDIVEVCILLCFLSLWLFLKLGNVRLFRC